MSLYQLKKEVERIENFESLSFPSFEPYYVSFLSKDLIDPIICFNRENHSPNVRYQVKIADSKYDISSVCFPNVVSDLEIAIDDDIDLQDLDLLVPLFQGKEFCVCPSNIDLFKIICQFINNNKLSKIYDFTHDLFNQLEKIHSLLELEEVIFDFDLEYFANFKEKDENDIIINLKKFDKNYIARFLYQMGCSKPIISTKIAKFASDICNIIDSNEYPKEQNEKSLRDTISEYFILQLTSCEQMQKHNYLFRSFYDYKLIDKDELIEALFSILNFTTKNWKSLLWFLDILPPHMKQTMEDLMCEISMKQYEKQIVYINKMADNDFQLFKQAISKVESFNAYANAIREDQVDQLQSLITQKRSHDQSIKSNAKIGELFFEVDESLNDTTLLNYAAFYGSIKCLKYLLLNGAVIDNDTFDIAINGQNAEILHIIQQKIKINFSNIKTAIESNANNIFDWLYDLIPKQKIMYEAYYSITCYNFHAFLKMFSRIGNFSDLKKDAINSSNYEILQLLNMISNAAPPKTIKISDIPTYSAIMKAKYIKDDFSSHLKYYQIGNNFELFKIYIKKLENINESVKKTKKIQKWLLRAVLGKEYYIVKYLLNQYDLVDFINNYESGFLRFHVANQNLSSILYLIIQNKRINVNATPVGSSGTAFTLSVWDGKFACARILYNRGDVNVNAIGNRGETPLTGCIESQMVSIAKILITFDDIDVNKPNSRNCTPFQMACEQKNSFDILVVLLKRKDLIFDMKSISNQFKNAFLANRIDAMKAIYSHPNFNVQQFSIQKLFKGENLNIVNIKTIEALSQMIDDKDSLAFQKLVLRISDPMLYATLQNSDIPNQIKSANLSHECVYPYYYAIKANKPETIEYLLQFPDIDVNAIHPKKGMTPLLQVIQTRGVSFDIFRQLLECDRLDISVSQSIVGSEIDFINLFIKNNKIRELSLYIESKIQKNDNIIDDDLFTFLVNNNLFDSIKLAIEKGYRRQLLNYALFASVKKEQNLDLFNFLIDLDRKNQIKIDFNYRSSFNDGKTILMESIFLSKVAAFDTLLKIGKCDLNIKNEQDGMTAFDYAEGQFAMNNNNYFLNQLIQTKLVDLLQPSYIKPEMSRINFIIESKNNYAFSFILTKFNKKIIKELCKNIDLQLIINNIEHFKSHTLLYFINNIKNRILETVNNDDCSFIYQFIKFYIKKEDDELINFKDTNMLKNMIDLGFDVNSVDSKGETILMYAIRNQKFETCFTILLFDEVKLKIKNKEGKDTAQIARGLGRISVAKTIERLIQTGHE